MKFYGGSAAQSSLIPFLDICLGVSHESSSSQDFLLAMREYMTKQHREFLVHMDSVACIRDFIITGMKAHGIEVGQHPTLLSADDSKGSPVAVDVDSSSQQIWIDLRDNYDRCIEYLKQFRSTHIALVTEYIMSQQIKGMMSKKFENSAGGKGTGGTDLMSFLKPVRDHCSESLLSTPAPKSVPAEQADYVKDNADLGDIDVYGQQWRYGW
jgi:indoleamine 2,3-dioxygenase